jgi:hypothetical protein
LLDDGEVEEATTEQRALLALFQMQCRNETARHFIVAEMRALTVRVAEAHAAARARTHRRNIEVARGTMAATEQCHNEEERRGAMVALAEARHRLESQYLSPPTSPGRSARRTGGPSPASLRTPSAAVASG